ncbi:hypothetical protein ABID22_000522 [Pontibacter aydingkolensis]|uniref:Uncharacterized protein n=1 Tax=Pontibacter aydingkolensis TaxID=1911536 RepID=A0ABS7CRY4_9BACT|nr:hypothetical protein [Pontibacter aydingkolensis]MBW7466595.1 hypothetical protein [Pontibacter aydingkolensis]
MKKNADIQQGLLLRTECGKEYSNVFKAIKLVRDEKHNFHIVYRTYSDEYIYSFCNPFQDTCAAETYKLISEAEAMKIFKHRLSQDNARELFSTAEVFQKQMAL